jgi:hypothetical protein
VKAFIDKDIRRRDACADAGSGNPKEEEEI